MLPSIFETCTPRDEILSGELSLDLFAAKLKLVVDGNAPKVYQDPEAFFANTFPTAGLKTLITEVFGRLAGTTVGSPVIRLETSFGGGKTHDEIALWHIARNGRQIAGLDRLCDRLDQIPATPVQIAAIACQDLDPTNGDFHPETGITTYTLWGEIAYRIGGIQGFSLLRGSDEKKVSPGTGVLQQLIQDRPTLIVLDEIAQYLRKSKAVIVGNSDLSKQVVAFLFALMDLAGACSNLVFVYSLASSSDTFADETAELQETVRASARQERILSPSTDIEIYNIVKQRLFSRVDEKAAKKAAQEYLNAYRSSRVNLPDACKDATYAQTLESSYPIHPELFNLLTKKIASIPNFNRTRGALRLFAIATRDLWRDPTQWMPMIHPHHLPIGVNEEITNELTSRLERPLMRLPIQADIYNANGREAHAQLQDQDWLAAGKPPFSTWIGRTIFLHSINQGIVAGIRRAELNLSLLTPGIEPGFVDSAIERLSTVAWYLDHDPITSISRFKEEPSINKIIAEEKEQVGRSEAKDDLRSRRDTIFANRYFTLVSSPESPSDVDDGADTIALCVIDFNEATVQSSIDAAPAIVEQIFSNTGDSGKFRLFRNRLLFLLANQSELERAIDVAREYRAIQNILKSQNRLDDLSESQQKELKSREGRLNLDVRIALTNAYRHLFYPSNDPVKAPKGLMHYPLPAQDASDVKGKNNQQEAILKALKDCQKIRPDDAQPYASAYVLQKVWATGLDSISTKGLREAFAKDLGLNLFSDAETSKLRTTIEQGLTLGQWDLKVGERVYIKTDAAPLIPPDIIEFSDRMVLYRRGILEPPKPREIEINAQVMPSTQPNKPVRVRWKASGALSVKLFQDGVLVAGNYLPSDEYEGNITQTTVFRVVADYGEGETAAAESKAKVQTYPTASGAAPTAHDTIDLFATKPEFFHLDGSLNGVFNDLRDRIHDDKISAITRLELSVSQVMDYRKLTTALPLLMRYPMRIEQFVTIDVADQFVRMEYQGNVKGFQSFSAPTNALLGTANVRAEVALKIIFEFATPVEPQGVEMKAIEQALGRNPVERLNLAIQVLY
ncbi:ATP-binding protein [Leptolyngbya sp. AN03gr2]|uniref:ATP-binding protein n=1 Tax=unclassified Leptolyngbya TaxID=2650499 RepID=UPI003D316EB5